MLFVEFLVPDQAHLLENTFRFESLGACSVVKCLVF